MDTNKAAIQVLSLRKAELIIELTKRGSKPLDHLRGKLKAEVEKLKTKYSTEQN